MFRLTKHPGLSAGAKEFGLPYMTVLRFVRRGMTIEQALQEAVRKRLDRRIRAEKKLQRRGRPRIHPIKMKPRVRKPQRPRKYIPLDVVRWRETLCETFVKTGNINVEASENLRRWARGQHNEARRNDRAADAPVKSEAGSERAGGGGFAFARLRRVAQKY